MQKDHTSVFLGTLRVGTLLALAGAAFGLIRMMLDWERVDPFMMLAFLVAGLIGVSAYQTAACLPKRLAALERGTEA